MEKEHLFPYDLVVTHDLESKLTASGIQMLTDMT